ncbi:MAG: HlyC/CorC family transporter [Gemmatimonadaceae bacterium]|nr:HlyC/CorC family transporter [Chitinophagaceae bacterium]
MINWILIGIIISIILIGFFAGIEIAFVSVSRLTVELKKKQGKSGGTLISHFMQNPSQFIGPTIIGFTIFIVFYGLLVGQVLSPLWTRMIVNLHLPETSVNVFRLFFETFLGTFIILILGIFLPKALWRAKNEMLLSGFVTSLINFFHQIFNPIASFFVAVSEWVLKIIFNVRIDERKDAFSRADLEHFFQQNQDEHEDKQGLNAELIENALSLPSVKVRQCLIPRKEIVGVEMGLPIDDVRKKFMTTQLSKLVVFEGSIDHILGYIHQLDMFKRPADVQSIMLPIPAVPESMSAADLISKFSRDRKSIAWVVDEFGGTAGIVTMEDLLEEIFGEIHDEYDTEEFEEKKLNEEEFIFSGRLELDYLNEKYNFELPADESETLSGYIISEHETIPKIKERIIIGDYEFDILSVSDTRIEMVKMKILK